MLKVFFLLFAILSLHCQYPSLAAEREDIILLILLMYVHNQSKICNLYVFFFYFYVFLKEISSAHRVLGVGTSVWSFSVSSIYSCFPLFGFVPVFIISSLLVNKC